MGCSRRFFVQPGADSIVGDDELIVLPRRLVQLLHKKRHSDTPAALAPAANKKECLWRPRGRTRKAEWEGEWAHLMGTVSALHAPEKKGCLGAPRGSSNLFSWIQKPRPGKFSRRTESRARHFSPIQKRLRQKF